MWYFHHLGLQVACSLTCEYHASTVHAWSFSCKCGYKSYVSSGTLEPYSVVSVANYFLVGGGNAISNLISTYRLVPALPNLHRDTWKLFEIFQFWNATKKTVPELSSINYYLCGRVQINCVLFVMQQIAEVERSWLGVWAYQLPINSYQYYSYLWSIRYHSAHPSRTLTCRSETTLMAPGRGCMQYAVCTFSV